MPRLEMNLPAFGVIRRRGQRHRPATAPRIAAQKKDAPAIAVGLSLLIEARSETVWVNMKRRTAPSHLRLRRASVFPSSIMHSSAAGPSEQRWLDPRPRHKGSVKECGARPLYGRELNRALPTWGT